MNIIDFSKIHKNIEVSKNINNEKSKITTLDKNIEDECVELKNIFIDVVNNDFNKNLQNGFKSAKIKRVVNIPNIEQKYKTNEYNENKFHYKYNPLRLHDICNEFDKDDYVINTFNDTFKIKYDIYPSIYFGKKTKFSVSFYTELL